MKIFYEKSIVQISACICGKDGLLSSLEEEKIFELISEKFTALTRKDFDNYIDDFFESDLQIEDYLKQLNDESLKRFVLKVAKESASADGLDIEENIALQKACSYWGISADE